MLCRAVLRWEAVLEVEAAFRAGTVHWLKLLPWPVLHCMPANGTRTQFTLFQSAWDRVEIMSSHQGPFSTL